MTAMLFVRFSTPLPPSAVEHQLHAREPRFRAVNGLVQKIYGRDPRTGDICGIYLFDSHEALARFGDSELSRSIPSAYQARDIRREKYDVLFTLWPERGPRLSAPDNVRGRPPREHRKHGEKS